MALHKRNHSKNWVAQFMYKGKTYIKSTGTPNKRVAEQIESKYRLDVVQQHELGIKEDIKLTDAVNMYLLSKKNQTNYKTVTGHSKHIINHFHHSTLLKQIKNRDINLLHLKLTDTLSVSYIKTIFVTFNSILKYAETNDYHVPKVKMPIIKAPKNRLRFLSTEQEDRLLYELHPDNRDWVGGEAESIQAAYDMVVCLLDTGCRYGELVRLEWSNIDLQQKTIHIYRPKVQNESILFMTDRVLDILTRRFNNRTTPWIFPNDNKTGPRKHPSWCIRGAMNRAGLEEYTTHDLDIRQPVGWQWPV